MNERLILESTRLELVPATPELLTADLSDRGQLGCLLNASIPAAWPPPLMETSNLECLIQRLIETPDILPWSAHYFLLKQPRTLVGFGGPKSPPESDGTVEIGYAIVAGHQRQGYATEVVNTLCRWAFSHPAIRRVIGETYPDLTASISVLEKSGFRYAGEGSEPGMFQYELRRN